MKFRIMTFNVQHCMNFLTREIDFDAFAEAIRQLAPDVVGLNEIRGEGPHPEYEAQAAILAEKLGWHHYFAKAIDFPGDGPYGNALLSKYPILSAETVLVPDPPFHRDPEGYYETRCFLKAKLDVPGGLTVLVTHFGLNEDEQENSVRVFGQLVEGERCAFMGDFNVTPDKPMLDPVRAVLRDTADLLPEGTLSFPSDEPEIKIDYIFLSHDLEPVRAGIPALIVSDHRPAFVDIEL